MNIVIVLSNKMEKNGTLNYESKLRAEKAIELYYQCNFTLVVTCGWSYRKDSYINIADAFCDYLIEHGNIRKCSIIVEPNSRDTVGDAFFTKRKLDLIGNYNNVTVVTSAYHVKRTMEIFSFVYGKIISLKVVGIDISVDSSVVEHEQESLYAFRQTFSGIEDGDMANIFERMRTKHPFYNGVSFPEITLE